MPTISHLSALATAAALAISLAACGETKIDSGKAEGLVKKVAESAGAKIKDVSCPEDIKAKKGADFDCDFTLDDGTKGTITIHQTDDDGHIETSGADVKQ
jgi:hypothetical protein